MRAQFVLRLHILLIGTVADQDTWTGWSVKFPCKLTRLELAGTQTSIPGTVSCNVWSWLAGVHAYLIYEHNGWRVLASQAEQLADKLLTLTHPFGHQVTG